MFRIRKHELSNCRGESESIPTAWGINYVMYVVENAELYMQWVRKIDDTRWTRVSKEIDHAYPWARVRRDVVGRFEIIMGESDQAQRGWTISIH